MRVWFGLIVLGAVMGFIFVGWVSGCLVGFYLRVFNKGLTGVV